MASTSASSSRRHSPGPTSPVTTARQADTMLAQRAETGARGDAAAKAVPPQYDYTTEKAIAVAAEQVGALRGAIVPINTAFDPTTSKADRDALLADAIPSL